MTFRSKFQTLVLMSSICLCIIFLFAGLVFSQNKKVLPPEYGIYHSAFPEMGPTEDVVTLDKIKYFEEITGKKLVWVYFSNNWFKGIKFPKEECETIVQAGSIPYIRMMPRSDFYDGVEDPVYSLQKIINGSLDEQLIRWAKDAKEFGHPIMVEFGTEVNGNWFSWSGALNGGGSQDVYGNPSYPDGPELFKDTYKYIIDLFREYDVDNITWTYHVNAGSAPDEPWNNFNAYYPGDDYIDWIGISIYGTQSHGEPPSKFVDVLRDSYMKLGLVSISKPIAIFEFGTIEDTSYKKSDWFKEVFDALKSEEFPRIKAISYWHSKWEDEDGKVYNMKIDSSPEALKTYKNYISSRLFISTPRLK